MHGKTGAEKLKAYFSGPICEQRRFPGMLYTIAIILLVLWLAGWLGFQILGGFIHILVILAVVVLVMALLKKA